MNDNQEKKYNRRQPTNKNTWILLIILSIVVICIAIYQMNTPKGGSVDYLIILLSIIVILASLFNIFKKKK